MEREIYLETLGKKLKAFCSPGESLRMRTLSMPFSVSEISQSEASLVASSISI